MTLFEELENSNKKSGIFDSSEDRGFSYPLGLPIIDELLGFKQRITLPSGEEIIQVRRGVPGGKITQFVGPSSSGKTAAAIQCGWRMVRNYGEDAGIIHLDAEDATEDQRILDLTGMDIETYRKRYKLISDQSVMTFGKTLDIVSKLCEVKEANKDRLMHDTGFYNIYGEPIITYTPTVIIIDSLLKIVDDGMDASDMGGATDNMRDAQKRARWLKNILNYTGKYNINIIMVNHLGNKIQITPMSGSKELPFIPNEKTIPGGEKVTFYSSSIILFVPVGSKANVKHVETEGYNGLPVKISVVKSRSGAGGLQATNEFIQEYGFDSRLTLMNFAKEKELIKGRNPKCYFEGYEDIVFDTRIFMEEMAKNPDVVKTLFKLCKPELDNLIREPSDPDDFLGGSNIRNNTYDMMDEILYK